MSNEQSNQSHNNEKILCFECDFMELPSISNFNPNALNPCPKCGIGLLSKQSGGGGKRS